MFTVLGVSCNYVSWLASARIATDILGSHPSHYTDVRLYDGAWLSAWLATVPTAGSTCV